jgi:phosphosulfolactate synthase
MTTTLRPGEVLTGGFDCICLPPREVKPREMGITSVLDKGVGLMATRDLTALAGPHVDIVKLGWGTTRLYPRRVLVEKIRILRSAEIAVCPGGTFLEVAHAQSKVGPFLSAARDLGFDLIEVSDGVYPIPMRDKLWLIEQASMAGLRVISEVGKKFADEDAALSPADRVKMIRQELEAGAWKVVIEGRESGTVGIYDAAGAIKRETVEFLISEVGIRNLIFEAPKKNQQVSLIIQFGNVVNLGNIPPEEILSVETLRAGLRADTARQYQVGTERANP